MELKRPGPLKERHVERMRMRRAPLAAAAAWFAIGIGLVRGTHDGVGPGVLLIGLALLFCLAVAAIRLRLRVAWVAVAGVWVGLGMAAAVWQVPAASDAGLRAYSDGLSRTVRARVVRMRPAVAGVAESGDAGGDADRVAPWESAEDVSGLAGRNLSVDVDVEQAEEVTPETSAMVAAQGGVRVSVYGEGAPELHCGDVVEMPLRMRPVDRFRDAGVFSYADYLAGQGVVARASVPASGLRLASHEAAAPGIMGAGLEGLTCRLAEAQSWAAGRMLGFAGAAPNTRMPRWMKISTADAEMLNAMLLGDRTGLTHGLRQGFERTGTFHLFVVSGLHVALLAGGLFWVLRRLRLADWLATLLTLLFATSYGAMTGLAQPVQRALVMTAVFLLARLLSRDRDTLQALGAAVLVMLVWAPASLFETSFQMTALAIVAIGGIAVPLSEWTVLRYRVAAKLVFERPRTQLPPRQAQMRMSLEMWGKALAELLGTWGRWIPAYGLRALLWGGEMVLIGLVAELVLALPMAVYFHRVTMLALPANLLVVPVLTVLAPAAVATMVCVLLGPWAAVVPGAVTALLLHGVRLVTGRLGQVEGADLRTPGPVWWVAVLAAVMLLGCCWLARRGRWQALAAAACVPLVALLVLVPGGVERGQGLEVTAIDVGQGDSVLTVNPEGAMMLVDAGGPVGQHGASEVVSSFDVGEEVVSAYLWSRRVRRLDVVVLTHAHTDHMGGMPAVLRNFRPRELWVSDDPESELYAELLAEAARLGIVVRHLRQGDGVAWGSVKVTVLSPAPRYVNAGRPKNDDSLVLRMDMGKASVLLEGDAEKPSEEAMLAGGLVQPVTLLKVGHHGSRTSSIEAFVVATRPQVAVVSVGRRNTFGQPRGEVIERFADRGTRLYRTDLFGASTFLLAADGSVEERVGDVIVRKTGPGNR